MSLDKIDALEARISKIIQLVKELKDEKSRLSAEVAGLQEAKRADGEEIARLRQERDQVRDRLEGILQGMEGLGL